MPKFVMWLTNGSKLLETRRRKKGDIRVVDIMQYKRDVDSMRSGWKRKGKAEMEMIRGERERRHRMSILYRIKGEMDAALCRD